MFMTQKSQALECFKEYQALVEGLTCEQIRILHTDRGDEYVGKEFKRYLMSQQIDHKETDAGCIAYAQIPDRKHTKLDDKVERVRFLGYSK